MDTLQFLRAVWPDDGLYCIAVPFPKKGYDHHVFDTIEGAAEYVASVANTSNVFYGTHTLKEARVWDPRHHRDTEAEDKPWVGGWRVRTQVNSRSSRVFFFDLDVEAGDDKKYETQAAAVDGLRRFVVDTHLPFPMVVSSGGGLHVYWIVDREIQSADWVATAGKLKQLAHHHGLKIDNARTTDTASVLRVAGTFNLKQTKKRPVVVHRETASLPNDSFMKLVGAAIDASDIVVKSTKAAVAPRSAAATKLGVNTQERFDGPMPTMQSLYDSCAQIKRIADVRGATSNEPEWYATAGALNYVVNGRKHFHRISSGHRDYDEDTCNAKFDQWKDSATGAVSCEKMESSCGATNAHLCHTCPFITRAKHPTRAASLIEQAPAPIVAEVVAGVITEREIAQPPLPWKRSREGGIVVLVENKEGRAFERKVYPYDLYPLQRATNSVGRGESQQWRAHLPHGETRDITIEASVFVDDKQLQSRLADHSLYPPNFTELKAYMSAYIQELQRLTPTGVQHNHLGWVEDNTKFVFPDKVIMPDGSEAAAQLAKVAATSRTFITQKGTLKKQVELLRFYEDKRYVKHQMFILSSLASPLFNMTGHNGVIIHAQGETGASKSSALAAAASFWGNPKKYVLNCTNKGATEMYRTTRLGILNNMPCCLDEITAMKEDVAKDFAMGATQNVGRVRSNRDGTPQDSLTGDERSSILMSTANVSLQSLIQINNSAGTASAVRVFEMHFDTDLGVHTPMQADEFLRNLFENYGWIGEQFMRLVVAKRDQVKAAIIRVQDELCAEAGVRSGERFWFSAVATALVAGDIAQKLGYLNYDLVYMRAWFLREQLNEMRGMISDQRDATSPLATLMDYLAHINGNIIQTRKVKGSIQPNIPTKPIGQLLAHHHLDTNIIHVLKQDFRVYCTKINRYSVEVLKALHASGVVIAIDKREELGRGSDLAKGRSWCFSVNLSHPDVAAILPGKGGEGD